MSYISDVYITDLHRTGESRKLGSCGRYFVETAMSYIVQYSNRQYTYNKAVIIIIL